MFRAAEKLVADGLAAKMVLDDGRARFELAAAHHDHLHCTHCDELVAVPCIVGHDVFSNLEAKTGALISGEQREGSTPIGDAPANLDHDPGNNRPRNLSGFCQRCHPIRNRSHHLARRITYPLRRALGDLFLGPYSA